MADIEENGNGNRFYQQNIQMVIEYFTEYFVNSKHKIHKRKYLKYKYKYRHTVIF
jgi:hypothetical protein